MYIYVCSLRGENGGGGILPVLRLSYVQELVSILLTAMYDERNPPQHRLQQCKKAVAENNITLKIV